MAEKRYRLSGSSEGTEVCAGKRILVLMAASVEIHADHLVFLNSKGELMFLFMLETIESCSEVDPGNASFLG